VPNSILIPSVVDIARQYRPKMLGGQTAPVVAAGGIYNGRSLASSLMQGAAGVWVGTRFLATEEAGCSQQQKESVVSATFEDTVRTLVITGRPLRCRRNEWLDKWEAQPEKIKELTEKGIVPIEYDLENGNDIDFPHLMGVVAGVVNSIEPARQVVDEMVAEAVQMLKQGQGYLSEPRSRL
jgi:NAD(P)H-dependent flavin oxidoreductase YrpB (nitropropane dioxygenase family)